MLILGIDTSCDDTSAAVVEYGRNIVSSVVSNQSEIHAKYGGIVPELASRRHIEMIMPVVDEALQQSKISLKDLSAVAVCHGPGLIGSLLVGCSFAKAVCFSTNLPLVAVNHLEGHVLTAFLQMNQPDFPFIALIVSGGHTSIYVAEDFGRYIELGRTRDDAAGEAYDKVSKLLGLEYPGGPVIDARSSFGNAKAIKFPRAYLPDSHDFSFSGLKTAVLNVLRTSGEGLLTAEMVNNICASFQSAVIDVLVRKAELALKEKRISRLVLAGGVAANNLLRFKMQEMADENCFELFLPPPSLCTDNAAMIAAAGYHHLRKGNVSGLDLNPKAYLPL